MSDFDILNPDPWFGPKMSLMVTPKGAGASGNVEKLLMLCDRFKSGDFSARALLEDFIVACSDAGVKRQAIRLYCYMARHEDISFIGRLLERSDHDETHSIVTYAPHTLSQQMVPYLFALLEEYGGTSLETDILWSINTMFPFQYDGGTVDIDVLGAKFSGFATSLNESKYYYEGVEAFAGNLTRKVVESAAHAREKQADFPLAHAPTLLSIWSGEKCPVFYGVKVTDSIFEETIDYVKIIASKGWVRGDKYFYGCSIRT